ncbi:kinase-like protein [Punctularia strigosozonata HHB-11173 SS5]|uniref:kinase-like protein n=1 Tax=Punctularia strigosozonata (strain HHB-11173) TaxID=741275 RepID=UPI0004417579|nr:kinase-like protein [Punctularia strigosozonata HHB-11173 SS5]EIN11724.1 kinase-like protein [Punctularia strigosozonata HHB-11173 SS5]
MFQPLAIQRLPTNTQLKALSDDRHASASPSMTAPRTLLDMPSARSAYAPPPPPSSSSRPSPLFVNTHLPRLASPSPSPSPSSATRPTYFSHPVPTSSYPSSATTPLVVSSQPHQQQQQQTRNSWASSVIDDVLTTGDRLGEHIELQGEQLRLVPHAPRARSPDYVEPAAEFEVVKRLGTGSYAVVYLVREVLSRGTVSEDDHCNVGRLELDDASSRHSVEYGREYAIKVLSKANLDQDALEAQMTEVTIHQSLPSHPNIVTLHRTYETSSYLLLLLEFVPGEDLFYFLEQARDHAHTAIAEGASPSSRTPPTPGLLSSMHPDQLLSRTRLRLVSSMFAQMCEAVGTCHDAGVFHRDIKPENFIVTDGWTAVDGRQERKVIVKLSDFGLSTTDVDSADMDCGSAPYMSYECRNNIAPTYKPRAADVWSLGIVLINMLYHYNPWTDTTAGGCSSFELFRQQPVNFFMQRFAGMTLPVAEFLAHKVFCIPTDPRADPPRVSAWEFCDWVKDLPALFLATPPSPHHRVRSLSSTAGHPIVSTAPNSRPQSRQASETRPVRRLSGTPTFTPVQLASDDGILEVLRTSELSPVIDEERDAEMEADLAQAADENEDEDEDGTGSRSQSNIKRRKRGARKSKPPPAADVQDAIAAELAFASQQLARELSRRTQLPEAAEVPLPPMPPSVAASVAPLAKKPSKWKLSFGKTSSSGVREGRGAEPASLDVDAASDRVSTHSGKNQGTLASNVTSLIMGLDASAASAASSATAVEKERGRARKGNRSPVSLYATGTFEPMSKKPTENQRGAFEPLNKQRGVSPTSTRSGRQVASSASSIASSNWRSSMSSAASSTSAFTRYSNGSRQSVSTVATSLSSGSWRNGSKPSLAPSGRGRSPLGQEVVNMPPRNVKIMDGVPWALHQLPRGMHHKPEGDIFGSPPVPRKQRTRKGPNSPLNPISERTERNAASTGGPKSPVSHRQDAATSTTDLDSGGENDDVADGTPKKVQKGQINALAKMLSALRR